MPTRRRRTVTRRRNPGLGGLPPLRKLVNAVHQDLVTVEAALSNAWDNDLDLSDDDAEAIAEAVQLLRDAIPILAQAREELK